MFRDEWLEPAPAPSRGPTRPREVRHARVRSLDDIRQTLDLRGQRDGLTFMPEMAVHAGSRVPIASMLDRVYENGRWVGTRRPVYLLEGLHCTGAVLGNKGPCDRACTLLWHADWLVLEPLPQAAACQAT